MTCGCKNKSCNSGCSTSCATNTVGIWSVNGVNIGQKHINLVWECLGTEIVQVGCDNILQITVPCAPTAGELLSTDADNIAELWSDGLIYVSEHPMDIYVDWGMFDAGTNVLTLTDNDAGTPDVAIDLSSLVSSMTANGDGTYTHSADGNDVIIDTNHTVVLNGTDLEVTNADWDLQTIDVSSLLSSVVNNADGTTTHSVNGVDTIIDQTNTTLVLNGTDVELTDGAGTLTLDVSSLLSTMTANPDGSITHSAWGVDFTIPAGATSSIINNPDGTQSHDDGNGNIVPLNSGAISDVTETVNVDGTTTYEHIDGNGGTAVSWTPIECVTNGLSLDANGCVGLDGTLVKDSTETQAGFELNFEWGDNHFSSGTTDESGVFLDDLDGNSPKADCTTATPLGYNNLTGEVVPIDITEVYTFPITQYRVNNAQQDLAGVTWWNNGSSNNERFEYFWPTHTIPAPRCIAPTGYKWVVRVDMSGLNYIWNPELNTWDMYLWINNYLRVNGSSNNVNWGNYPVLNTDSIFLSAALTSNDIWVDNYQLPVNMSAVYDINQAATTPIDVQFRVIRNIWTDFTAIISHRYQLTWTMYLTKI